MHFVRRYASFLTKRCLCGASKKPGLELEGTPEQSLGVFVHMEKGDIRVNVRLRWTEIYNRLLDPQLDFSKDPPGIKYVVRDRPKRSKSRLKECKSNVESTEEGHINGKIAPSPVCSRRMTANSLIPIRSRCQELPGNFPLDGS